MLQSTFQTRQLIDPNLYWFAIPNIGSLLKGLSQRKSPTLEHALCGSGPLTFSFDCSCIYVSGADKWSNMTTLVDVMCFLKTIETPSGLVVRVIKD
ncbi:hypothetical protein RHMOL_Rhmol01G0217900 [Rhododendron molle]|uniref:Uncharacterized protein n=1 Tax=Rhododendron molle TaxID=49168 RepID=A0ACC0Q5E0_RHOML|nr:hypothetical protein RHMOL_Rhmol01G0217900 [Rhododendron molle]